VESGDWHSQLLRERTRESTANTHFESKIADVLVVPQAPAAGATAQHGVTGDPAIQPRRINPVTERGHCTHPLVTESHRILRVTFM
jgi:hypothetical protein